MTSRALWRAPTFIEVDVLPKKRFSEFKGKLSRVEYIFFNFHPNLIGSKKKYAFLTFANKGQHLLFFDQKVSVSLLLQTMSNVILSQFQVIL